MSNIDEFYHKDCEKIDANCIICFVFDDFVDYAPAGLCVYSTLG